MKFLTKINRNYLLILFIVLIVFSASGYFIFQKIIVGEAKEILQLKMQRVIDHITEYDNEVQFFPEIEVHQIDKITSSKSYVHEVELFNKYENENEPYLELDRQVEIGNRFYSIKLRQSLFEKEDLVLILAITLTLILVFATLVSYIISSKLNRTVWQQFETNLNRIDQFNFTSKQNIQLINSGIDEFARLNKVVKTLTGKLMSDYLLLKQFTENASHEIQTPVAIALLNLEEMLQQDIDEETMLKVVATTQSLKRLSNLNKNLILLSKIENRQYEATDVLNFGKIIEQKFKEFEPLIETKEINVNIDFRDDFRVKINPFLAETMIANLLSNAIRHNVEGGLIDIYISSTILKICNTGNGNTLTNDTIFNRFSKGDKNSFGLGLSIVRDICCTHDLTIQYNKNDQHCFEINKTT